MARVLGWLYVSRKTATFVSEERSYMADQFEWQALADQSTLESFLARFKPLKEDAKSRHSRYYFEFDEGELSDWFSENIS